jgi:hypothetical protein
MVRYEYYWLHIAPGSGSTILLGKASSISDLIVKMQATNLPTPQVSKMRECLATEDMFSYLLDQWHILKMEVGKARIKFKQLMEIHAAAEPKAPEINSYKIDKSIKK